MQKILNFSTKPMAVFEYIILMTLLSMLLFHVPLYDYVLNNIEIASISGMLTFLMVIVSLFVVNVFIYTLLALISSRVLKYFNVLVMFLSPIALYFMVTYNVILDRSMMGNLFNTNTEEAFSYYHPKIFFYLLLGLLFAYLISKITLKKSKRLKIFAYGLSVTVLGVLILYLNASKWLWLDKHAKKLGAMAMPWSYVINSIRYKVREFKANEKQILLPNASLLNPDEKQIVVLIIGESARAKNFSLYGYKRETNPKLKMQDVVALANTKSTTTYTTASVHSMLSYLGESSDAYEPLPNYLQRQGVEVLWRTNNWGEPTLKVSNYQRKSDLKTSCVGKGCDYDGVLLTGLKENMQSLDKLDKKKIFYVLHTSGSHGPSYYQKYPKTFEKFKPVCKTVDLKKCTEQELINTYDNTILYTDYFIAETIEILKAQKDTSTLLIYISDHGESLGEYGLYLHGTPYSIAPDVQKEIPFIVWASEKFKKKRNVDTLDVKHKKAYGQDNIFHSIVGAFELNSTVYDKEKDIFNN